MSIRIRRCLECPKCHTRYLLGFSPYSNGSYVVSVGAGSLEEFALYCSCGRPPTVSRWSSRELKSYQVLNVAYQRGYGVCGEIVPIPVGKAAPKHPALRRMNSTFG
jgi:hypothetical protein